MALRFSALKQFEGVFVHSCSWLFISAPVLQVVVRLVMVIQLSGAYLKTKIIHQKRSSFSDWVYSLATQIAICQNALQA